MLPVKKILAPTDFSEISLETLGTAAELARHFGAELEVLHVIPTVPALPSDPHYNFEVPAYQEALRAEAEKRLAETVKSRVGPEIAARPRVSYGEPAREIVRVAEDDGADLIVIATHGLTGWQHLVFGSVAERVVRLAACPVLTIRGRRREDGR